MITEQPGPGSVITWQMRFACNGPAYQYTAFRVEGRGWFTSSTKFNRALMWDALRTLIAVSWEPLGHAGLRQ